MTDSFVFYRSFHEAVKKFPPERYGRYIRAIIEYTLDGTEPNFPPDSREEMVFIVLRPFIDTNSVRRENGKKGGRPSKADDGAAEKTAGRAKFIKPTAEEVRAYCTEKGYDIDAVKFVSYYESNGWKVGKNPMRNWHSAISTWVRNSFDRTPAKAETPAPMKKCPKCGKDMISWHADEKKYVCSLCGYKAAVL